MKTKTKRLLMVFGAVMILGLAFGSGMKAGAATVTAPEPGSQGDPLISSSYLEKRLAEYGASFRIVKVKEDGTLSGPAGTQFVLYTGEAKATANLLDVTAGKLIKEGAYIEKYHMYIIPADNGGCKTTVNSTFYVQGEITE